MGADYYVNQFTLLATRDSALSELRVAAAATLGPGGTRLALEELVGRVPRRALGRHRRLQPRDLGLERRDAFGELLDRKQREILPDLVDGFFLREFVVDRHVAPRANPPARLSPAPAPITQGHRSAVAPSLLRKAPDVHPAVPDHRDCHPRARRAGRSG